MPDSNSNRFIRRLREAIDAHEPVDTPEFRAEAASSEANRRAWRQYALLASAIEESRERQPTVDLGDAVLAALRSKPTARSDSAQVTVPTHLATNGSTAERQPARLVLALSATAALLLFGLMLSRPATSPETVPQPIAENTGNGLTPGEVDPAADLREPEIDELLADATAAYHGLARETRGAFADLALFVPDFEPGAEVPMPPMETDDGWLPPSLRNGFDRTLDLLIENASDESTRT